MGWIAVLALFSGGLSAEPVRKTLQVSPAGKLTVRSDLGSVVVRGGSQESVELTVYREDGDAEELSFELAPTPEGVLLTSDYSGKRGLYGMESNRLQVRYVLRLPTRYDLDIETEGGSITVQEIEGDVRAITNLGVLSFRSVRGSIFARAENGSLSVDRCIGDIDIQTQSGTAYVGGTRGDVQLKSLAGALHLNGHHGEVEASTGSGTIQIDDVTGPVVAKTKRGDIEARLAAGDLEELRLTTLDGAVTVQVPPGLGLDLDLESPHGKVRSAYPVTRAGEPAEDGPGKPMLRGEIQGGGAPLVVRATAGARVIKG